MPEESETLRFLPGHQGDIEWLLERLANGRVLHIDSGCPNDHADPQGIEWSRDRFFVRGWKQTGNEHDLGARVMLAEGRGEYTETITGAEYDRPYRIARNFPRGLPDSGYRIPLPSGTYELTLHFEKMHCQECRSELETTLKKLSGFKSFSNNSSNKGAVTLTLLEKAAVPRLNRLPKDLKLMSVTAKIRGTVSFKGGKATLVAKGSGVTLALADPKERKAVKHLAKLKNQLAGKNRFILTGKLEKGNKLILSAFQKTAWKDK